VDWISVQKESPAKKKLVSGGKFLSEREKEWGTAREDKGVSKMEGSRKRVRVRRWVEGGTEGRTNGGMEEGRGGERRRREGGRVRRRDK
jgi:hypothetical protein